MTEGQYKERLNALIREQNKYDYMFPYKPLYEDAHVMDNLDKLSLYISREIKKLILKIGIPSNKFDSETNNRIIDKYESMKFIYTGYNFDSDFKDNMLIDISNGNIPEPVKYLNNESVDYPIYYKLIYNPYFNKTGIIDHRIKGTVTERKIRITINAFSFQDIKSNSVFRELSSTVSHELQHMCDMYIPDRISTNLEGNILIDSLENRFNLHNDALMIVKDIMTLCSKDEIRGRLAQLKQFIILLSKNKKIRDRIFAIQMRNRQMTGMNRFVFDNNNDITEKMLINNIYMNNIVQTIIRENQYNNSIIKVERMKKTNEYQYYGYLLVIGFYMYGQNMLRLPKKDEGDRTIVRLLADENNIRELVDFNTMCVKEGKLDDTIRNICNIVHLSIRANFNYYIKLVDDRIQKHIHDFYTYEKVNDVFEERMPYMDDCVILYC